MIKENIIKEILKYVERGLEHKDFLKENHSLYNKARYHKIASKSLFPPRPKKEKIIKTSRRRTDEEIIENLKIYHSKRNLRINNFNLYTLARNHKIDLDEFYIQRTDDPNLFYVKDDYQNIYIKDLNIKIVCGVNLVTKRILFSEGYSFIFKERV